jgi:hypothetical protein
VKSVRLDLGTFYLTGDLRVSWTLAGPSDARSTFRLTATRITDSGGSNSTSSRARSWSQGFSTRDDRGLVIGGLEPDEWHLTLAQRIPHGAVGYSGTFTVYTEKFD